MPVLPWLKSRSGLLMLLPILLIARVFSVELKRNYEQASIETQLR